MTLREIQDQDAFIAAVRAGTLADHVVHVVQGVDLGDIDLAGCDVHGAVFVGCALSTKTQAANLGGFAAGADDADDAVLDAMLRGLLAAPSYKDEGWFDTALSARELVTTPQETLGIPTWFYGHEPTNLFCTHVAKFFSNALREDGLLAVARHGVVFAPGGPGTMQEVFQDACQNAYGTVGDVSPMVFLGQRYWTQDRPALPLLRSMTTGMQLAERFAAFDDVDAIVAFLKAHPPVTNRK